MLIVLPGVLLMILFVQEIKDKEEKRARKEEEMIAKREEKARKKKERGLEKQKEEEKRVLQKKGE